MTTPHSDIELAELAPQIKCLQNCPSDSCQPITGQDNKASMYSTSCFLIAIARATSNGSQECKHLRCITSAPCYTTPRQGKLKMSSPTVGPPLKPETASVAAAVWFSSHSCNNQTCATYQMSNPSRQDLPCIPCHTWVAKGKDCGFAGSILL